MPPCRPLLLTPDNTGPPSPAWLRYGVAAVSSLLILVCVMQLWRADLRVPFSYTGDALAMGAMVKGLVENHWYLYNPSVGMPTGRYFFDYPVPEVLHLSGLKAISLFTHSYATVLDVYFVLSVLIGTLTALLVFMRLTRQYCTALVCSLLYTFLPFRFLRGIPHLFYSCYYVIPLTFLLVFWTAAGDFSLLHSIRARKWRNNAGAGLLICILVAASGIYYAFFSAFFVFLAGIYASANQRSWRAVADAAICCGVMLFVVFLAVSPTLVYTYLHGSNPQVAQRSLAAADTYGLRITQLLLPVSSHRIPYLARLKAEYNEHGTGAPVNENDTVSLGVVGTIGFVVLMGGLCAAAVPDRRLWQRLWPLSMLNVWAVLLGSIGGFGCLFALTVTAGIRAYNRISPYIAFLCFSALIVILDHLWRSWATSPARRNMFHGVLIIMLVVGLFDQTSAAFVPDYAGTKKAFLNDGDFVAQIEASMPQKAMVFQLPYHPWPEGGSENRMQDYDLVRPYLHSSHLRWSYGGMRGREADLWNRTVSGEPAREMLAELSRVGFKGIYIDRFGYADHAGALETELAGLLGTTPIVSGDNRLCYFSLGALAGKGAPDLSFVPVESKWEEKFSGLERNGQENWRWCGNSGALRLINKSKDTAWVRLSATVTTGWPEDEKVQIGSALFSDKLTTNVKGLEWERVVALPPGESLVKFTSNAKRVATAPGESRVLVFALHGFTLTRAEPPSGGIAPGATVGRPVEVAWEAGSYGEENGEIGKWHWCSAACEIALANPSTTPAHIRITMGISVGHEKPARFTIKGPGISETVPASSVVRRLTYTLDLPPGKNVFKLFCDSPRVPAPGDSRNMVFMVSNFSLNRVSGDAK